MKLKTYVFVVMGLIIVSGCDMHEDRHYSEGGTVISMFHSDRNDSSWTEHYIYNENNNLERVNGLFRNRRYAIIEYNEKGQIHQILQYKEKGDELLFRDSLVYNDSNLLIKNYHYSINHDLELTRVQHFNYDDEGKISSVEFNDFPIERVRMERYEWDNGNIVNVKQFDEEGVLLEEYNYQYDDMWNYKKQLSHEFLNYLSWSLNNITWFEYVYHTGPISDLVCNPCISEYRYNKMGLPVTIETSSRLETKIEYR